MDLERRHHDLTVPAGSVATFLFHGKRHPDTMGEPEVGALLSFLARDRSVSASTQNQALGALLFLHAHVLGRKLGRVEGVTRAKMPERLPVVLARPEVQAEGTQGSADHATPEQRLVLRATWSPSARSTVPTWPRVPAASPCHGISGQMDNAVSQNGALAIE
jgi:hypothetical protein